MPSAIDVEFGPVIARIIKHESNDAVYRALEKWLGAGVCDSQRTPDVVCELGSNRPSDKEDEGLKTLVGDGTRDTGGLTIWDGRAWEATLDLRPAGGNSRHWSYRTRNGTMLRIAEYVPEPVFRFLHEHYFTRDEVRASTFLYRHLIPNVQVALLEKRATFVHASAIRNANGGAILLCGWGGSGKTSASTVLCATTPERWSFLSDDLAILDANGDIHGCPLPLNIFPYNLVGFAELRATLMNGMGWVDRTQWRLRTRILGNKGVTRRTPPPMGQTSQARSQLKLCIQLQRSTGGNPVVEEMAVAQFAHIAKNILTYELRHGLPIFTLPNAFYPPNTIAMPAVSDLEESAERVVRDALCNGRALGLTVPRNYSPPALAACVERLWDATVTGRDDQDYLASVVENFRAP